MVDNWLKECAEILLTGRDCWEHLIPSSVSSPAATALVQQFFTNVSALMDGHVRGNLYQRYGHGCVGNICLCSLMIVSFVFRIGGAFSEGDYRIFQ